MNRKEGILLVISGPSGAGKGTVCRALLELEPDISYSVSVTSRPPRPGEKEGVHYFFVSREKFEKMVSEGQMLEWAEVYGNYYGTPREPVLESLKSGRDILLEIDVQGALQVKEKFPAAVLVFILPPSMRDLEMRLKHRATDAEEEISKRLRWAEQEIRKISLYDYLVVNDTVERAVSKVRCILTAERCRPRLYDLELL